MEEENKHAMMECIMAEPELIRTLTAHRKQVSRKFVALFLKHPIKKIYFSGQASGTYIGMMLKPMIEELLAIEVTVTNPAAFLEHEQFNVNGVYRPDEMAMLCPAHSGSTKGPVRMAEIARQLGIPVICTTYDIHSELAKRSTVVIDKMSYEEASYIETKGHIASLTIFFLCILETAYAYGKLSQGEYEQWIRDFEKLPAACEDCIIQTKKWYEANKSMLISSKAARYIGFGSGYALALEGSLKIAEATALAPVVYEMEEFMHQGTTQINADSLIFLIAPKAKESQRLSQLLKWCRQHSKYCVLIAHNDHPDLDAVSLHADFLDKEYIYVLEYLIPFQMIAHLMAMDMGLSTIHARNDGASSQLETHVN